MALPKAAGLQARGQCGHPGQHQAGHVTEVVGGVGQQGQGVDLPAVPGLDGDKPRVEHDADQEGAVEIGGGGVVVAAVVLGVAVPVVGLVVRVGMSVRHHRSMPAP
jgi:hypothetical protein